MKKIIRVIAFFVCLLQITVALSDTAPVWSIKNNALIPALFIENKGQINESTINNILFTAHKDGLQYYFTRNAIHIKSREIKKREASNSKFDDSETKEEGNYEILEKCYTMQFLNTNSNCSVVAAEKQKGTVNYLISNYKTLIASTFKSITYKNLYPGIDMEVHFPEDKGFKYSFVIRSGANPKAIQFSIPEAENITLDDEKNLSINSAFGRVVDNQPVANYTDNSKDISCAFVIEDNKIGFKLGSYNKKKDILLDPWVIPFTSTYGDYVYDVDWDYNGNVYVYGGDAGPQVVTKYDSTGAFVWTVDGPTHTGYSIVGDFAVNRKSGTIYIGDPGLHSALVLSFNNDGTANGGFMLFTSKMNEVSRLEYNDNVDRLMVGGGGTDGPPTYFFLILDSSLVQGPLYNFPVSSTCTDMWGLTSDKFGNMYFSLSQTQGGGSTNFSNKLASFSPPSYLNLNWLKPTGFLFREITTQSYNNGYNGMCSDGINVYTYNGGIIKKWATANGTIIDSASIAPIPSPFKLYWGGVTADSCGNIFVGERNKIWQLDPALNITNSIATPDSVYDVKLGRDNNLYACGYGFVARYKVTIPNCIVTGLKEEDALTKKYSLVPNPNNGSFSLFVNEDADDEEISIIDQIGQIILKEKIHKGYNYITLKFVANGLYHYNILKNNSKIYSNKFIIH